MGLLSRGVKFILVIRGPSGCGKSTLSKTIFKQIVDKEEGLLCGICSTDDFFIVDGVYKFDPKKLGENHKKNREKCQQLINEDYDCIIIDNTNLSAWEIEPYVEMGINSDYFIRLLTSEFPPLDVLVSRNVHGVPRKSIERMLERWEDNDTVGEAMATKFDIYYDILTETLFKD